MIFFQISPTVLALESLFQKPMDFLWICEWDVICNTCSTCSWNGNKSCENNKKNSSISKSVWEEKKDETHRKKMKYIQRTFSCSTKRIILTYAHIHTRKHWLRKKQKTSKMMTIFFLDCNFHTSSRCGMRNREFFWNPYEKYHRVTVQFKLFHSAKIIERTKKKTTFLGKQRNVAKWMDFGGKKWSCNLRNEYNKCSF